MTNNEYYKNIMLCMTGVLHGAVERVLDNDMFSVIDNCTEANRVRFFRTFVLT